MVADASRPCQKIDFFIESFPSLGNLRSVFPRTTYTVAVNTDASRQFQIDHSQSFTILPPRIANIEEFDGFRRFERQKIEWTYPNQNFRDDDVLFVIILNESNEVVFEEDGTPGPGFTSVSPSLERERKYMGTLGYSRVAGADLDEREDTVLASLHFELVQFPIDTRIIPEPPIVSASPARASAPLGGEAVVLEAVVENEGLARPYEAQWLKDGEPLDGADGLELQIPADGADRSGLYAIRVSNESGTAESSPASVEIFRSVAPVIVDQPRPIRAQVGETVSLSVFATGSPDTEYMWFRNGNPTNVSYSPNYEFKIDQRSPGTYQVKISNSAGTVVSEPVEVALGPPKRPPGPRLVNLSTRAFVSNGEGQAIVGFVIEGPEPARALIRGVVPSAQGLAPDRLLANPKIALFRGSQRLIGPKGPPLNFWLPSIRPSSPPFAARIVQPSITMRKTRPSPQPSGGRPSKFGASKPGTSQWSRHASTSKAATKLQPYSI